jgi:hypothetical protein
MVIKFDIHRVLSSVGFGPPLIVVREIVVIYRDAENIIFAVNSVPSKNLFPDLLNLEDGKLAVIFVGGYRLAFLNVFVWNVIYYFGDFL